MSYIRHLKVAYYRNYERAELDTQDQPFVILTGPNGSGKTNLLEAVSLIQSGRGLRSAPLNNIQKQDSDPIKGQSWGIKADLISEHEHSLTVGVGYNPDNGRKRASLNGEAQSSQSAFRDFYSCLWLTPQMDGLFLGSASDRRRFIDRIVTSFDPAHSGRLQRYERSLSQRSKLLKESREKGKKPDDTWLSSIEKTLAETAIAIAAARLDNIQMLEKACDQLDHSLFPQPDISLDGFLENNLRSQSALDTEEAFEGQLRATREQDSITGGSVYGVHKTDLITIMADKKQAAENCSTGEQKALLTSLILAHSILLKQKNGFPPIVLLDEIAAHLDTKRREALFEILRSLNCQIWITGTDEQIYPNISDKVHVHLPDFKILS